MMFSKFFKARKEKRELKKIKSRENDVRLKVNTLLKSIYDDTDEFTHDEQATIIKSMLQQHKDSKAKQRQDALNLANEITLSLKLLNQ